MGRTKVCFISLSAYPLFNSACKSGFGGAEVQLFLLASELAKDKNFDVSFVVADHGQSAVEEYRGISVYRSFRLGVKKYKYVHGIGAALELFWILKRINADVYIQRAAGIETAVIAVFCKLFYKKFIYMLAHEWDSNKRYQFQRGLVGYFFIFGLRRATERIAQNREQQGSLHNNFGLDSILQKSAYEISVLPSLSQDYVLWVGRCEVWKQPKIFLQLAELFPKEQFVMVLANFNDGELFKLVCGAQLRLSNLRIIQDVPFKEVDQYFQHAKLFVNTSVWEGFPNTFIQAAKNKTPILSLNVNPDNFLTEFGCGWDASGDLKKLVKQCDYILTHENIRRQTGERAYDYAKTNHDIRNIVEQFKEIIRSF